MNQTTGGSDITTLIALYGIVALAALWLAMIVWTNRDMRARSRDPLAQVFVTAIVALLNIPGLLIYFLLRPRETLAEAYERSLEEEALLQEIEEKPTCPGCSQRVQAGWQVCPHCHTKLKKACHKCGNALELPWTICPYCAAQQVVTSTADAGTVRSTPVTDTGRAAMAEPRRRRRDLQAGRTEQTPSLEFVDGE
ncbi:MAG: zinc ribbon domain-containing protein [Chloroflexi bacterium]|nr:zinc ribbon domain-containing protein [Chloroflexota bacterium]